MISMPHTRVHSTVYGSRAVAEKNSGAVYEFFFLLVSIRYIYKYCNIVTTALDDNIFLHFFFFFWTSLPSRDILQCNRKKRKMFWKGFHFFRIRKCLDVYIYIFLLLHIIRRLINSVPNDRTIFLRFPFSTYGGSSYVRYDEFLWKRE